MRSMPTDAVTDAILSRVQGEFVEMPGLRLTEAQAQRLWGLDPETCAALLDALVERKFLFRAADGAVMRVDRATPIKIESPLHSPHVTHHAA